MGHWLVILKIIIHITADLTMFKEGTALIVTWISWSCWLDWKVFDVFISQEKLKQAYWVTILEKRLIDKKLSGYSTCFGISYSNKLIWGKLSWNRYTLLIFLTILISSYPSDFLWFLDVILVCSNYYYIVINDSLIVHVLLLCHVLKM